MIQSACRLLLFVIRVLNLVRAFNNGLEHFNCLNY